VNATSIPVHFPRRNGKHGRSSGSNEPGRDRPLSPPAQGNAPTRGEPGDLASRVGTGPPQVYSTPHEAANNQCLHVQQADRRRFPLMEGRVTPRPCPRKGKRRDHVPPWLDSRTPLTGYSRSGYDVGSTGAGECRPGNLRIAFPSLQLPPCPQAAHDVTCFRCRAPTENPSESGTRPR